MQRPWEPPINQHGGWSMFLTPEQQAQKAAQNAAVMRQWQQPLNENVGVDYQGVGQPQGQTAVAPEQVIQMLMDLAQQSQIPQVQAAAQAQQGPPQQDPSETMIEEAGDTPGGSGAAALLSQAPSQPALASQPQGVDWQKLLKGGASALGIGLLGAGGNQSMQTVALKAMMDNQRLKQSAQGLTAIDKLMMQLGQEVMAQEVMAKRSRARFPLAGAGETKETTE